MKLIPVAFVFFVCIFISSCEFNCSLGKKENISGSVKESDGVLLYNNIQLKSQDVKVKRAYLLQGDNERVPDNNVVDFKSPVKLELTIDSGWVENDDKVLLGASEKIVASDGTVILDEADLFSKYTEGISATDARHIYISAALKLKENSPPASFTIFFRVWDKNGKGSVEGSYQLNSR